MIEYYPASLPSQAILHEFNNLYSLVPEKIGQGKKVTADSYSKDGVLYSNSKSGDWSLHGLMDLNELTASFTLGSDSHGVRFIKIKPKNLKDGDGDRAKKLRGTIFGIYRIYADEIIRTIEIDQDEIIPNDIFANASLVEEGERLGRYNVEVRENLGELPREHAMVLLGVVKGIRSALLD